MSNDTFTYEARGQILIIHLPKELDHHNCRNLRYETDLLLAENYINKVIFDFSKTEFMDSSGIGLILGRQRCARTLGGTLRIQHAPEALRRVLQLANIPCVGGESGETI